MRLGLASYTLQFKGQCWSIIQYDHVLFSLQGKSVVTFPCKGAVSFQACPSNPQLVVCVSNGDIFLIDGCTTRVHQLTFTKGPHQLHCITSDFINITDLADISEVSAGLPPQIIRRVFDRHVGILWQNSESKSHSLFSCNLERTMYTIGRDDTFHILYEEVSFTDRYELQWNVVTLRTQYWLLQRGLIAQIECTPSWDFLSDL